MKKIHDLKSTPRGCLTLNSIVRGLFCNPSEERENNKHVQTNIFLNFTCCGGKFGSEWGCLHGKSSNIDSVFGLGLGTALFGVCKKVENLFVGSFSSCTSSGSSFLIRWSCSSCKSTLRD